jgi:hypothetical protein
MIAIGALIGLCAAGVIVLYCCAIHREHEGSAFLRALSEVKVAATTREDFTKKMMRYKEFESSSLPSACYEEKCYQGVGYGIDNSTLGRYLIFPGTNLAAGVYFDSNNIVQGTIVTLDRIGVASATLEERPEPTGKASVKTTPWSGRTQQIHLVLDDAHRQDIPRLSVSCFTSWLGCDTAQKLLAHGQVARP